MPRNRSPYSMLKRGDYWYFRVWDPEHRAYTTARSTGKTNKAAARLEAERMINQGLIPVTGQPLVVSYAIERLKASVRTEKKKDGNSVKYVNEGIGMLEKHVRTAPAFSRLKLPEVESKHLYRLIDHLKKQGLTPRTINRIIGYLAAAIREAARRGYAKDLPSKIIKKETENLRKRESLTADEIRRVLSMPPCRDRDVRYKPYIITAICSGMRKGELRALQWKDIDFNKNVIHVRRSYTDEGGLTRPKTEKSIRDLPLLKPIRDALGEIREASPYTDADDYVFFQAERGAPLPNHFVEKAFREVMDAIGIDAAERKQRNLVGHSMRHSFVTFGRSLLPDFIVGGMSGHSTSQMIDLYGKAGPEHFKTAQAVLDAALTVKPDKDDTIN